MWADLLCPWCGLANYRLNQAVEMFGHRDEVQVVHRSYKLDMPAKVIPVRDYIANKMGADFGRGVQTVGAIEAMAEREGLHPYRVMDNHVGNTDAAHELLAYATAAGKNGPAWQLLFDTYFGKAEPIFTVEDLLPLTDPLGLDLAETEHVLRTGRFRAQVQADVDAANRLGVRGVPFIVVDGRYAIPGAVDTADLTTVLIDAWNDTSSAPDADGQVCGPDGCAVPARD